MLHRRFPQIAEVGPLAPETVKVFQLRPHIVSVLDYSKGFGHDDLVILGADDIAGTLDSMHHHWLIPAAGRA